MFFAVPAFSNPQPLNPANNKNFKWRNIGKSLPEYEKLKFSVKWNFIEAGEVVLEIRGFENMHGRKAYCIYSKAQSAPFFDAVFAVNDVNRSWIDYESVCSLKFWSQVSEGGWQKEEILDFNQPDNTYLLNDNGKMQMGYSAPWAQDVLSAFYYMRLQNLEIGKEFSVDVHTGDKTWSLIVKILRKETVSVPLGEFECFVIEPELKQGARLFGAQGKLQVWLTADKRKIPVLVKAEIPVGVIIAELQLYN
jgi:hypothetical protein